MHIDRLLTLYLFAPLRRISRTDKIVGIPILMYHSISNDDEKDIHPYFQLCTSPEVFASHMAYLHKNGYSVISLTEAVKLLSTAQPLRYVVITFDDGYRDFYTHAFPVLKRYGFTATVFLPAAFIGNESVGLKGKKHLDWEEIRELQSEGIRFGSHSLTHPQLSELHRDKVEYEIRKSKEIIEDELGQPVISFSYPYAFPEGDIEFVKDLQHILQTSGFRNGVTTRLGTLNTKDDILLLKRIPINFGDDLSLFQAKLIGAYDWVGVLQRNWKILKRRFDLNGST